MSSHPRVTLTKVSYVWGEGGTSWTLPAGAILDVAPGSPLEQAIGAGNLGTLTGSQLSGAANGAGGAGISN
jgi:hypothetical protein